MSGYLDRPAPSGLADVIEVILDKGIVIDAYVRVSALGIELLTVDARVVIASVDTYLRFAEATNRLELEDKARGLPELIGDIGGQVIEDVAEKVVGGEGRQADPQGQGRRRRGQGQGRGGRRQGRRGRGGQAHVSDRA